MRKIFLFSFLFILFVSPRFVLSQDGSGVGINLGVSTWFNNCDVPSGGQDSALQPSFGPNFTFSFGRFRVGGTFYYGNFDIDPEDGVVRENNEVFYTDSEARVRGFTSRGNTKRIDFTLNTGFAFSRYAVLSISLVVNRHEVDLATYWPPVIDSGGVVTLPSDRQAPFEYTDTQYWLGQHFSGSVPIETVSTRFSFFYGVGLLVILGESGDGSATHPSGNPVFPIGARTSYTDENGQIQFPPRDLGTRPFGENVGISFNSGVGFQLLDNLGVYGGYNFKFFSEDETDIIDHSQFHGPFFGLNWTVK